MANINDLKTSLGAGMRTDKYVVTINNQPSFDGETLDTLCKATSFPAKTIGQTEIWKLGRKSIIPGEVEYENTWDVTFYERENGEIRGAFLDWMSTISDYATSTDEHNDDTNVRTLQVKNLQADGSDGQEFLFFNAYPQNVSSIEFADESTNTIAEFTVTFSFDYWEKA